MASRWTVVLVLLLGCGGCLEVPPGVVEFDSGAGGSAITHSLIASGHEVDNMSVFTTATISPEPGSLITVGVAIHRSSAVPDLALTGGGLAAWDPVATITYNLEGETPLDRVTIFRAMSAAPGVGPITITSGETVSNCQWIVSQWAGVDGTGSNGEGAIAQTISKSGEAVDGLTASLAPFGSAANVAYGVFGVATAEPAVSPGPGFTAISEQTSGEGTPGAVFAEWAFDQPDVVAIWSGESGGALAVELVASR